MACPHATGAAAYIKSIHPTRSPVAIKSALMTTASPMNPATNPDTEFAYRSGHINPLKAIDLGLVYDAVETDYVKFLCRQGYSTKQLQIVTGDDHSCSQASKEVAWNLNCSSFALSAQPGQSITRLFHRTVTNVGPAVSKYRANVKASTGLEIEVVPKVLSFNFSLQRLTFIVTVRAKMVQDVVSGALVWDDGLHQVRSPIVSHVYAK